MTCTSLVQHRAADGSISERQVDLMFPATERTVLRLMQAWWDRKVSASRPCRMAVSAPFGLPAGSLVVFQAGSPSVPAGSWVAFATSVP
jgi:hypothetical protein